MTTLRFSVIDREMTIPTQSGAFVASPYDPSTHTGSLGSLGKASLPVDVRSHVTAALGPATMTTLGTAATTRPIVVLVHGFNFDPREAAPAEQSKSSNPHDTLFSYHAVSQDVSIDDHATPWPLQLGIAPADAGGATGLAVCFGWYSVPRKGTITSDYRKAYRLSTPAAAALRVVLDAIHAALPTRRIRVMAHSLGSGPVIKACRALAAEGDPDGTLASLERVLLLAGAEYCDVAVDMLASLDALGMQPATGPWFINLASWHDNVLGDAQTIINMSPFGDSDMIGYSGLLYRDGIARPRWIDLELGSQGVSDWLIARGLPRLRRGRYYLGHWEHYTYFENMRIWRDVLRDCTVDWEIAALRAQGIREYDAKNPWA
jgi:hypothetical protein